MSGKVAGASPSRDTKALKSSSVENRRSEQTSSGGGSAEDEILGEINLFDYLVESTLHMDTNKQSSLSSIHSSSSNTSRRRSHQLRVKRYTDSGDEVDVHDNSQTLPESAPSWVANHESTSSLHSMSGKSSQPRSMRAKRYHTVHFAPSPVPSQIEPDNHGTYGSVSSTRVGPTVHVVDNETEQSYIFEDQESGEFLPQYNGNVSTLVPISSLNNYHSSLQDVPTFTASQRRDAYLDTNDENDSGLSTHGTSAGISTASHVKGDEEATSGQKRVESAFIQRKSQQEEEYLLASSTRERESILKKRAAGLASAAAGLVQEKREASQRVRVGEPLQVGGDTTTGENQEDMMRIQRIHELEQRKRQLEAVAKEASSRRAQEAKTKMSRPGYRTRTVNIDVYTGEVIGDLPTINETLKVQERPKYDQDDSSSVHSATEYDLPITKARRSRRRLLFVLLLIGLILGLYFGLAGRKDERNDNAEAPGTAAPASVPTLVVPTIGGAPTVTPTARPSLRPPSEPVPTNAPTPFVSFGTPIPTTNPFNNTDQGLVDLILGKWPLLAEAISERNSPQLQALEWLSSDDGLDTYSDEQKVQRFTLATFYFSAGGDMWNRNDGWLSTDNECNWFTTSGNPPCNQELFYVRVELNDNNLNGTIPAELALLSNNLETISLLREEVGSSLYGTIPTELGLLTMLEFFNVRGNALEGSIPSEFASFTDLRQLIVRQNMISGEIPSEIGIWSKLRFLEVEDNQIRGSLPSEVGMLTLLESILLSRNQLSGDIPSQIGQLMQMTTFSASMNGLTSIPTEIGNLSSLITLDLGGNNLRGTIPSDVGRLSNLSLLALGNNTLTGTIPTTIGNLILLQENLDLSANQLFGPIPTQLGRLVLLRQLLLNSNQLTGQIPTEFAALSSLNVLLLESNMLTGTVPGDVCTVFDNSLPLFVTDCFSDVVCDCCTHCCRAQGGCECLFSETSDLQFRCIGFP